MSTSISLTIDGKACTCLPGEYLADVAKRNGIDVPLLCGYKESLLGRGSCRVCIVEVVESGRSKIVASCIYPVQKECEVFTANERVTKERGVIFALLKGLAPESELIASMAKAYGAPYVKRLDASDPEYLAYEEANSACMLCGLCVEACKTLGTGAISTVGRGVEKKVSTPFDEPTPDCIGCGSCAAVCPTRCIPYEETATQVSIW